MEKISRRDFLKISGAAAIGAAAVGCIDDKKKAEAKEGEMEYRINPGNGDKVSLLGYGCMRWPMIKDEQGKDIVDQKTVNMLVDRAIEAGVNYFDTSPVYLQGQSERASGIALSRHPRNKYFIATKLSNFGDRSPEGSKEMYRDSFEQMETD